MDKLEIFCGNCKEKLENQTSSCHKCGSEQKTIHLLVEDEIRLYDQIKIKSKGKKDGHKINQEQIKGYELSSNGNMVDKIRIIDNINDVYFEEIIDLGGNIIHKCQEKLSEHKGHGNAKKKKTE
jgi:hypothetical protein